MSFTTSGLPIINGLSPEGQLAQQSAFQAIAGGNGPVSTGNLAGTVNTGSFQSVLNQIPGQTGLNTVASQTPLGTVTGLANPLANAIQSTTNNGTDLRVRLAALNPSDMYANSNSPGIMAPLQQTSGMIFPYSPSITLNQSVDYMDIPLVHSNTNYQAYTRTPSVKITVAGKFTVQSQWEGQYALACIHFLRTASKSHFGETDTEAGLPPPVLLFSGYGNFMFGLNQVGGLRVILNSHSWSYDENIDTINVTIQNAGIVRLPSLFTIQCELTVIQTPARMRQVFNFASFASGALLQNSDGWI